MRYRLKIIYILAGLIMLTPSWLTAQDHGHDQNRQQPVTLDNLVVTATKLEDYVRANPQQVEIMNRDEIDSRHILNLEEALDTMAGVDVHPSSGIGARISIRGSGKSRGVLVLLDGRPLNSSQYGGVDLQTIPIEMIKSITVFKPPVPVWLGSGASEGAVCIVSRAFEQDSDEQAKPANQLKLNGGSYGLVESRFSHIFQLDASNAMVTAAAKHKDGKRSNHDLDSGSLTFHWDLETAAATRWECNGRYYLSDRGTPGPLDNPTPQARQKYQKGSIDARISDFIGTDSDYKINLYGDFISLKDDSQSGFTSKLDEWTVGVKAETAWSPDNHKTLRFTTHCNQDTVDQTTTGRHQRETVGGSVDYDYQNSQFTATFGLRGDYVSDFSLHPGCHVGVAVNFGEALRLKGNLGYSEAIPSFGQLYQTSHGSFDQVRGNPDLDEEKIITYDLGCEYHWESHNLLQLTLFRSDTDDLIIYRRRADLIYQPINTKKAWRHGLELTLQYKFGNGLMTDFNYILQDSKNRETGGELNYTPHHKLKTTLRYTVARTKTRLETTLRYVAKQYTEVENQTDLQLDDYLTVDLKAIQPFLLHELSGELFLEIVNLFDADYEVHQGYPDDGIRILSGLSLSF